MNINVYHTDAVTAWYFPS